jgi:ATP-dependent Lon protease
LPDVILPLLCLRSTGLLPHGVIAVQMGSAANVALARALAERDEVAVSIVPRADLPADAAVGRLAVRATTRDRKTLPDGVVQLTLAGAGRVRVDAVDDGGAYPVATVTTVTDIATDPACRPLTDEVLTAAARVAEAGGALDHAAHALLTLHAGDPGRVADLAAHHLDLRVEDRDAVVQALDVAERLRFVADRLAREEARRAAQATVDRRADRALDRQRREQYLRAQLAAIQAELGEGTAHEAATLAQRVDTAGMPDLARAEALREVERLRGMAPSASEYQVTRTYVETMLALPWGRTSGAPPVSLAAVEAALGERHWGLREAKERILEALAVHALTGGVPDGSVLCFVGPPGTGKTSLAEVIARALGRPFQRIAVGGVRDEAEIRGHRRTYVGAYPGRVVQALRRAGACDPVLLIDELDKMAGGGGTGDPTAAMLEVLDPAQHGAFVDHYLNVPVDLSRALFIGTANALYDIPEPLRDRLEVLRLPGYTVEEKIEIAWRYLLPRLLGAHGLTEIDLQFTDEGLSFLATRYAREAGLRAFERYVATLMRRRARRKADGESGAWVIDPGRVEALLGPPPFPAPAAELTPEVGAVSGLAWTAAGGELMTIEAVVMPGTGRLTVTGQLGEVMRESVDAALSYVRARAAALGVTDPERKRTDVHVHFPAGAVPKDGPSAGVAVTLALASALTRRPARRDVAMTGEVTLRGRVLEVGGIKEKVLAAYRAGVREVVLPAGNDGDVRDLPPEVRSAMRLHFVRTMDEIVAAALLPGEPPVIAAADAVAAPSPRA